MNITRQQLAEAVSVIFDTMSEAPSPLRLNHLSAQQKARWKQVLLDRALRVLEPATFVGRRLKPEYQEELAYQLIEYGYPHPDEDPPDADHFQAFANEPKADQLAFFKYLVDQLSTKVLAELLYRSLTEEDKQ